LAAAVPVPARRSLIERVQPHGAGAKTFQLQTTGSWRNVQVKCRDARIVYSQLMEPMMAQDDPLKDVLSMLSAEQLHALRTALGQPSGLAVPTNVLREEQINALKNEAANYRQAQKQASEAFGVLWNASLDLAIGSGDVREVRRALTAPNRPAFYDNCSCVRQEGGGGAGPAFW
jgi:hypothetical protein